MRRPVIGIVCNSYRLSDGFPINGVSADVICAVRDGAGAVPVMIPALSVAGDDAAILETIDGLLCPGGDPNVHPTRYGAAETPAHAPFDPDRDRVALDLIRGAVGQGLPVFGICRGFQEMAVAFGAMLHPAIQDLAGRDDHRAPKGRPIDVQFAPRHPVSLSGEIAQIIGAQVAQVNSLHGQGVETVGPRMVVEGTAPDGTIEAFRIAQAPGFAHAVQWHPEWCAAQDPVSRALFGAFGDAARDWAAK